MTILANVETVRAFYDAGPADDDSRRHEYAEPDVVWHVPGTNPVTGVYRGFGEVFGVMGNLMQPLDRWEIGVVAIMGNDNLVMSSLTLAARRKEIEVETTGGHVFRFNREGRIAEVWGFAADQAGLDRLFSS